MYTANLSTEYTVYCLTKGFQRHTRKRDLRSGKDKDQTAKNMQCNFDHISSAYKDKPFRPVRVSVNFATQKC